MKSLLRNFLPILLAAASVAAVAAPVGYSVNSDAPNGDTLHRIDLATGVAEPVSELQVISAIDIRQDIEGLAFDSNGTLWAVDEQSMRLFPVSTKSGIVLSQGDVEITGLTARQSNDFGMTFTCTGELYVSSVAAQTLYRLAPNGTATAVGAEGALGHRISALASWGEPAMLFGLGNGLVTENNNVVPDNRSLFSIDPVTGVAKLIGPLGPQAAAYYEAGLSFSADGTLWALTDRGGANPNEILQLDLEDGTAKRMVETSKNGFESLAIAPPGGCTSRLADDWEQPKIPTLDNLGKVLALLVLLGTGLLAIHQRTG